MATCNDCIHKDVCYLIEHYGRDLCSDDACDKFLATPVRHGYWIECKYGLTFECSECKYPTEYNLTDFCPNCGAKMDESKGGFIE